MIFCKAPIPGQVKTRLMPELTARQAADVHSELALGIMQLALGSRLCPVQLWCAPSLGHPFFTAAATRHHLILQQQQGHDLGGRMYSAFRTALKRYTHALIIGCDCPSLTPDDLDEALSALNKGCEVVLGPAEDGGYVLVGVNRLYQAIFDNMPWGSAQVLAETRDRIRQLNLCLHELAMQWDVDTPRDLARYRAIHINCPSPIAPA